ncbi:NlpC/P60 family protein [Streptomyces sp. ODS28]|uniref:C40 family peptidase n=1 Tax=Streptomyces sp. ODS28 TaxID=3136688 RepID=UPI0031EB1D16
MASHRKPRTRILQSASTKRGAIGVTTAAFASVTLLSQGASAAPSDDGAGSGGHTGRAPVEDVQRQVDRLYHQAESATQKYNEAKERTRSQRSKLEGALNQVAQRTEKLNDARRTLGTYAAAQYRTGGISETATLLLTQDPQGFFKQKHMMDRMTGRQKEAVAEYEKQQRAAASQRSEATQRLSSLASTQRKLKDSKQEVQGKLADARKLLSRLTAQEKARLDALERKKEAEARRKAAEAEKREQERREHQGGSDSGSGSGSGSDAGSGSGAGSQEGSGGGSSASSKAEKVIAFAKQQLGKPYVWGATGPSSYDCSGLTQDAWKSAGISLPRTTWDQVKIGTKVSKSQLQPGDLVFFYDDISHVGIYAGGGQMIHAPKPGANVRYESINYMPFHSAVRPG